MDATNTNQGEKKMATEMNKLAKEVVEQAVSLDAAVEGIMHCMIEIMAKRHAVTSPGLMGLVTEVITDIRKRLEDYDSIEALYCALDDIFCWVHPTTGEKIN